VVRPLGWFFCVLGRGGSFHFVPCILPSFGCFGFIYEWQGFIMLGPMSPSVRDKITLFTCKQLPFFYFSVYFEGSHLGQEP
jgi:hypothetical protein